MHFAVDEERIFDQREAPKMVGEGYRVQYSTGRFTGRLG